MLCLKKTIIGFGIFLPVLLSAFFVSPSYAITDRTVSFTTSSSIPSSGIFLFPDCDLTCYSDYSYLIVDISNSFDYGASGIYWRVGFNVRSDTFYHEFNIYPFGSYTIFAISDFYDLKYLGTWGASLYDITFTLTDSLPSGDCPVCEECQVCPAIPENPYDNKLDNITMAIYTCGGILLVLYFFYCIYRIIIRNSGVDKV